MIQANLLGPDEHDRPGNSPLEARIHLQQLTRVCLNRMSRSSDALPDSSVAKYSGDEASAGSLLDSRPGLRLAPRDTHTSVRHIRRSEHRTPFKEPIRQHGRPKHLKPRLKRPSLRDGSVKDRCDRARRTVPRLLLASQHLSCSDTSCLQPIKSRVCLAAQGVGTERSAERKEVSAALLALLWA